MNRYDARENAFKLIFSVYFQKEESLDTILEMFLESGEVETDPYFESLIRLTYTNLDDIDALIEKHLNNWSLRRISKVSLAALRVGTAEIKYVVETPNHVAINEAVELAKKFDVSTDYLLGIESTSTISVKGLSEKQVAVLLETIECFREVNK